MPSCIIADDSKIMRMLLSKIMENFGYTVTEAEAVSYTHLTLPTKLEG